MPEATPAAAPTTPADTSTTAPSTELGSRNMNAALTGEAPPAPAEGEAKPEETPAAPAAPTREERLARAKAAEERIAAQRRLKREQDAARAKAEAEAKSAREEAAKARAEAEQLRAWQESLKSDPLSAFEKMGITADAVAKRAIEQGDPLYKVRQEMARELEAKLAEERKSFEAKIAEERAAREALLKAQQEREQAAKAAEARTNFLKVATDESKFPHVATVALKSERRLLRDAAELWDKAVNDHGYQPSDDDVLGWLEEQYSEFVVPRQKAAGTNTESRTPDTKQAPTPQDQNGDGTPRTLSNSVAQTHAPDDLNLAKLSKEERNAKLVEMLRKLPKTAE